jgi:parallel beta-helix repeat protein
MSTDLLRRTVLPLLMLATSAAVWVNSTAVGSSGPREHYVSPHGSPSGSGAPSDPWDLATALAHPTAVQPGDTIWLRGGTYHGTFTSRLQGVASRPIIVRQFPGESATIDAAGATEGSAFEVQGGWTWFWGLEVVAGRRLPAVEVAAPGARFINMSVHQATRGFSLGPRASNAELYGNVVYDNGRPQFEGADGGIVIEGSGPVVIADNVVIHNLGAGIRAGRNTTPLLDGNVVSGNGPNIEIRSNEFDLVGNHSYAARRAGAILGGNGACGPTRLANNSFADEIVFLRRCDSLRTVSLATAPPGAEVVVSRNRYESARMRIVVKNRDLAPAVTADPGGLLQAGDSYRITRAGDEPGVAVVSGVFDGKPIQIPMQGAHSEFAAFLLERSGRERTRSGIGQVPTLDLKLWLRADTGVTHNGSFVSQWADQSGSGSDATQPVAVHQPAFVARAFQGRPAIRFDGATDFMTLPMPADALAGATVVFVGTASHDEGLPRVVISVARNGSERVYVNGAMIPRTDGRALVNLDRAPALGRSSANRYFAGDAAEVLVYQRALTDVERQSLELHLSAKYAAAPETPTGPGGDIAFAAGATTVPSQDLKLWLRADAGVTMNGAQVSQWSDQSGTATNAAQTTATRQPTLIANAINGLPALSFDGVDDFMTFNLPMTGFSGATIFLVAASTSSTQDGTWHGATNSAIFWNENSDWSTIFLTPFQRHVKYQFGTGWPNNISTYTRPVSLGTNFSVNTAIKNGANEALYVNGSLVFSAGGKGPALMNSRPTGNLGRGYNDNTYFAGRIAEVLVYTRALTDAERQNVEAYLLTRYPASGATANQAPVANAGPDRTINILQSASLSGSATDDQLPTPTLTYNWTTVSGPGTVTFASATSAATTATFSATGAYVLRLTASDGALTGSDEMSVTVNAAPPGSIPQQELKLWLKADAGITEAAGRVSLWADQSGAGANASQPTAANQPLLIANAINGLPALAFDGIDEFLTFAMDINNLSGMSVFLVSASTSSTQDGSWHGATHSPLFWNETAYWSTVNMSPYQRVVKFRFGTGQANNMPSYTRPASIGSNFSVNSFVKNGATEYLYIDGASVLTATGKLSPIRNVRTTGNLGRGHDNNTYFAGRIAEVLVYTRALSDGERQTVEQYLMQRYPPVVPAPNQPPTANAGADQTISLFQSASLNGAVADDGLPGAAVTSTWSKVSGPGTVTFANPNSATTTATFSAAGAYVLRLTANDSLLTGSDDVAITVNAPPPGSIPQQDLKLWLKADAGITQSAGRISNWADQSGSGTNAVQPTAANQPLLLANAVNGLPAVAFDGIDEFLTFAMDINNLSGMSVFLVSASTSSTQDGSWHGATHSPLFWNEVAYWSTVNMSPYQRVVKFRFGTGQANNVPAYTRPTSIGSNFSVNTFVKNGATENLYINGASVLTATGKLSPIRYVRTTGNLGRGHDDNTYFAGRISEVLVYTRALSDAERQTVEQYLLQRYPPAPGNQAPQVNAGPDQTVAFPSAASLTGSATDDQLPNPTLTTLWSKVSGPGTVTFGSASAQATTATFSATGVYVLRLTANDGALSTSDDVTITLNTPPPDTTPPVITNVSRSVSATSATVTWTTNEPSDSQVFYGTSTPYSSSTTRDAAMVLNHSVFVSGLQPNTTYHFSVRSADPSNNVSTSPDATFTTPDASLVTDGLVGHYSMAQSPSRPTGLNDLQHAEDFENWIVWERAAVVTPNVALAPNGTQTADKVALAAPRGLLYHKFTAAGSAQTYTFSIYMRTLSGTYNLRLVRDNTDCWCGTPSPTLTVTTTWQRFTLTFPTQATETGNSVGFGFEEITPWNLPVSGEVLVWGAQLEPGAVATPYPPMAGFPMRDQAVPDLSGRNNHAWLGSTANGGDFTQMPGQIWAQHDPARRTQSLYWDGVHRWVQIPNTPDLNLTTSGTWTVLAKPETGWKDWAHFFNRATGPGTGAQFALGRYSNTSQISFYTGNDAHPYRGGNLPMGVWSVITVTLNGGVLVGYIDSQEIFRFTGVAPLRSVPTETRIGTFNVPPAYNYRGDIGAVLFYNRALSAAEVAQNAILLKSGVN